MALLCLRLFGEFMLLLLVQPSLRALLKAYLEVYFEIDEYMIAVFCSRIVWQMESVTNTMAFKVREGCYTVSEGRPLVLLQINLN